MRGNGRMKSRKKEVDPFYGNDRKGKKMKEMERR